MSKRKLRLPSLSGNTAGTRLVGHVSIGVVVVSLAAMALALAACGPQEPDQHPRPELTNPFHSRVVLGEGFIYEIEGFTHGHHPDYSSGFEVTFTNPTHSVWPVE